MNSVGHLNFYFYFFQGAFRNPGSPTLGVFTGNLVSSPRLLPITVLSKSAIALDLNPYQ
ncbi:MAG: hypothetical protein AB4206_18490 [Xenococcaceae cyanobacterium]